MRLLGGTRYRAFSPSDTCPDNNLVTSRGVRFVDFEWGCFRDIVLDAAYFRVPFPACEASFALPPGLAAALLDAWRTEIAGVWPELDEPERLDAPPARRAAVVGLAVHLVAAAAAAPAGRDQHDRARRRAVAPDQHRAVALLARSWPRRRPAPGGATADSGRGRRGPAQAVPRRARGAGGLPGPALGGLSLGQARRTAARPGRALRRARSRPASIRAMSARVQAGQTKVTRAVRRVPAAPREPAGVVRGARDGRSRGHGGRRSHGSGVGRPGPPGWRITDAATRTRCLSVCRIRGSSASR